MSFPTAGKEVSDKCDNLRRIVNRGAVVTAVSSIRKRRRLEVSRSGRATRGVGIPRSGGREVWLTQ